MVAFLDKEWTCGPTATRIAVICVRACEFIRGTGFQPVFLCGKHGLETRATLEFTCFQRSTSEYNIDLVINPVIPILTQLAIISYIR
jgi:hypothetical protein